MFCNDFPNLAILTKSATPGEVQLKFVHAIVGNKSLCEYVVVFSLAGDIDSPSVVSTNMEINYVTNSDKIYLPITEVFLCAATGNLARSKTSGTGHSAAPSSYRHSSRRPQSSTDGRTMEIS